MARSYSSHFDVHRALALDLKDPVRGRDVRALQAAALRRLSARGIHREMAVDGSFGPTTAAAVDTAAFFLGALTSTVADASASIGVQRMVRHPGSRTEAQVARGRQRLDHLRLQRDKGKAASDNRVKDHDAVVRIALRSFKLLYDHRDSVHYTQGGARWSGIDNHFRAAAGQFPRYADCSSAFTWCYWNALTHVYGAKAQDVLNGSDWKAGYTGTLLAHGRKLSAPEPGCAIIYGSRFPGEHVAMYDRDGLCYSHGSEAGPYHLNYRYRPDILEFRAYV